MKISKKKNMQRLCVLVVVGLAFAARGLMIAAPSDDLKNTAKVVQDEKVIAVDKTAHDFGIIAEDGGPKTATFVVTNRTEGPVLITNVRASCGCTSPDWTRTPIESGKTGVITAKYDPKGRPGPFDKTITVYTNSSPERIVVHITGTVQ